MILFHSLQFIGFFLVIFCIYWLLPKKSKNIFLLAASYIFYSSWNWKFLGLILISTFVNYYCGIKIRNSEDKKTKRTYLLISILTSLTILGIFKYFNFFVENFVALLNLFGLSLNFTTLKIILPLGISFYTFQTMSYPIDIYRGKIKPTKNIINFSLFVAYFPQLLAGPIERARNLIPKLEEKKYFKNIRVKEGIYLFTYGLFKKVVLADTVAVIVNTIFAMDNPTGAQVLIATYGFVIQVYCDFSGYSNMARGISHFFGIPLSVNFNLPYFAKSPAEHFKRWHITLTSWIREYVYIPLFFTFLSKTWIGKLKNLKLKSIISGVFAGFVALFIFGFWHGPEWHFIGSGIFFFFTMLVYIGLANVFKKLFPEIRGRAASVLGILLILLTFHVRSLNLLIFRLPTISKAISLAQTLFTTFSFSEFFSMQYKYVFIALIFLTIYETIQYVKKDQLFILKQNVYILMQFYMILFFIFLQMGAVPDLGFYYFGF